MRGSSAFHRLVNWRAVGLWVAFIVVVAPVMMTLAFGGNREEVTDLLRYSFDFWRGPKHPLPGHLLMMYAFIAYFIGTWAGGVSARIRRTYVGWTLPGVRRGLVTGELQVMLAGVIFSLSISGGLTMRSVAATGTAAVMYAVGVGTATWMRLRTNLLVVGAIWIFILPNSAPRFLRADFLFDSVVSVSPLLIAIPAFAAAIWLLLRGFSPELHRREIGSAILPGLGSGTPGLEEVSGKPGLFRRAIQWLIKLKKLTPSTRPSIRPGSVSDWLRSLRAPMFKQRGGWIWRLLKTAAWTVVIGYTFNIIRIFVVLQLAFIVGRATLGLAGPFIYPLSRRARATVLYIVTLNGVIYLAICGVLAALLLSWKPWPQFLFTESPLTPTQAVLNTGFALIWIPLLQWKAAVPPLNSFGLGSRSGSPNQSGVFLSLIAFAALVLASSWLYETRFGQAPVMAGAAAIVGFIAASQSLLFVSLRRAYSRRDLV